MESNYIMLILLQVFLITLNAIFACAEIAVISMNDNKMEKMATEGDKRAIRLKKLTSQPARFLATIQVAITLSGFLGSAFAADNFSGAVVDWLVGIGVSIKESTLDTISVIAITLVLSYVTLVFGELVPKRVAMRNAEKLALAMSALISVIARIFAPIVWLLTISTNAVLRLLRIDPNEEDDTVSEEEIRMMVDVGSEKGTIDHHEKQFIQNVFEFDDLTASEIATHRKEMAILRMDDGVDEWANIIQNSRFNMYPVCDKSVDNVVGILNAREYLHLEDKSRENVMRSAVSPAYFVPESIKADVLFKKMKQTRNSIAVLLDEYGGVEGIVTLNDLIARLVGIFGDDEETSGPKPIEQIDSKTWKINGTVPLYEIEKAMDVSLPTDEYDTLNGLILGALGTVPMDGETANAKAEGLDIEVLEVKNHRVESALVRKEV